jgi:hypothetical protein
MPAVVNEGDEIKGLDDSEASSNTTSIMSDYHGRNKVVISRASN